jgi:hypothetical protein
LELFWNALIIQSNLEFDLGFERAVTHCLELGTILEPGLLRRKDRLDQPLLTISLSLARLKIL